MNRKRLTIEKYKTVIKQLKKNLKRNTMPHNLKLSILLLLLPIQVYQTNNYLQTILRTSENTNQIKPQQKIKIYTIKRKKLTQKI